MGARRIGGNLDFDMRSLGKEVVADAAQIVEKHIDWNISPPGGLSLVELREAGYPLSSSGFRPGAAGLDAEYQIIEQSGGLRASLGIDQLQGGSLSATIKTFVGFDDGGSHTSGDYRGQDRTVDMDRLLNWLINGTPTMVGRPVLINSLGDSIADLVDYLRDLGLVRRSRGMSSIPRAPVKT